MIDQRWSCSLITETLKPQTTGVLNTFIDVSEASRERGSDPQDGASPICSSL